MPRTSKLRRNNTSGYVGVSYHTISGKWRCQAMVHGKVTYLGSYTDPLQAAARINQEYARLRPDLPKPNPEAADQPAGDADKQPTRWVYVAQRTDGVAFSSVPMPGYLKVSAADAQQIAVRAARAFSEAAPEPIQSLAS